MKRHILALCILFSAIAVRADAQLSPTPPQPTISVSGTAEVRVAPDEVNLRLGVETRDPKLEEAVKQNDTRLAAVLKFLKDAGIESKDVQTDFVEIHPHYNEDGRGSADPFGPGAASRRGQQLVPEFFLVRRNIGVRLRKVSQFDAVLAGVIASGANHVMGIDFRTTELRKHRDAARQQAIRAAREKAVALSRELDASIGKPQTIQEQTSGGWWSWSGAPWSQTNAMFQNSVQAAPAPESSEGNLAVGLISIHATVHVSFALN